MTKVVLRSLNILLGLFFIFLGILKITPFISRELHKDLRMEYAKYAKVFPLAQLLKWKVPSKWYRRVVGGTEIFSGFLLLVISNRRVKNAGNVLLMATKILNLYSHYAINDQYERMAPSLVFFFMLACRLVVDWQYFKHQRDTEMLLEMPEAEEKDMLNHQPLAKPNLKQNGGAKNKKKTQ